jgi:hypothetical protein
MKDRPITPEPESKEAKEPMIPLSTFTPLFRWLMYGAVFFILLIPFPHTVAQWVCGALILGWFAGQLNAIINKK